MSKNQTAKTSDEVNAFIKKCFKQKKNLPTREEIAMACGITKEAVRKREEALGLKRLRVVTAASAETLESYRETLVAKDTHASQSKLLEEATRKLMEMEKERQQLFKIRTPQSFTIKEKKSGNGESEAVAFMVASDWHVEEPVDPKQINGMNEYNLEISRSRAEKFFQNGLRLIKMFQQDTKIEELVLPILGDMITNSIHEEMMESNLLPPAQAINLAQDYLVSGIEFLLKNSDLKKITAICHTGNHGRMTKKVHISTEAGNSIEEIMYRSMAMYFRNEPRVEIIIPEGMQSYHQVYNMTIRLMHGHSIKFGGGVGGVTIPIRKAISQWNRARRADLTIMGHFHQMIDGGEFMTNGSLIGYNAFADFIKADYERPKQAFFLISNYHGGEKSFVAPIRLD